MALSHSERSSSLVQGGPGLGWEGDCNVRKHQFTLRTDKDVKDYVPEKKRLYSATHEEISQAPLLTFIS